MKYILLTILPLVLFVSSCSSNSPKDTIQSQEGWSKNMRAMANDVNQLIPFVYDSKSFEDPKNRDVIASRLRKLSKDIHTMPKREGKTRIGKDPLMVYSINNLKQDLKAADESFNAKQYSYSRGMIKASLNHCFRCHTRNSAGVEYNYWALNTSGLDIPANEKAELLVATRQYQKAADVLKSSLRTEMASYYKTPYLREKTLKQLMVVLVRAKDDPQQAYKELNEVMSKQEVPAYLMQYIEEWERSVKSWMQEKKEYKNINKALRDINKVFSKADKITKTRPQEAAFVEYLRLTSMLHKALGLNPNQKQLATIYYQLGKSYAAIKDSGFWELPEIYFESCIYSRPKTKIAKKCYRRYEGEVMMGFTGSAGTFLPSFERQKLNELKKVAGLKK